MIDSGFVGQITRMEHARLRSLQAGGFMPIISAIGYGQDGKAYNINADVVAGKMAQVLGAEKLVMLTNTPGVLDKQGQLLRRLSAQNIDALFADGTISGGMLPKISSALDRSEERRVGKEWSCRGTTSY